MSEAALITVRPAEASAPQKSVYFTKKKLYFNGNTYDRQKNDYFLKTNNFMSCLSFWGQQGQESQFNMTLKNPNMAPNMASVQVLGQTWARGQVRDLPCSAKEGIG
jgi:hypothetical protein